MSLSKVYYLDFQTTGFHASSEIIEVGFGEADGEDLKVETFLVRPEGAIPKPISLMTGLKGEDFTDALSRTELIDKLKSFISRSADLPVIIHFAQFENQFLNRFELNTTGILCTHEIAKRLYPDLASRSLKALAGYLGYSHSDFKRSLNHIEATHHIWLEISRELQSRGLVGFDSLKELLESTPPKKKTKTQKEKLVRVANEIRLSLPEAPGIYQMKNKEGQILYVGKAKNLKSRVNSYYRGTKSKKLKELISQVWTIEPIQTNSHFEACILENDLIKKIHPPYNTALKTTKRSLVYFDRFFEPTFEDEVYTYGPFTHALVFDLLDEMQNFMKTEKWSSDVFYEEILSEDIGHGFEAFCLKHNFSFSPQCFSTDPYLARRGILASLLWWCRQKGLRRNLKTFLEFEVVRVPYDETLDKYSADEIGEKFFRSFLRLGLAFQRPHWIKRLAFCSIEVFENTEWKPLVFSDAELEPSKGVGVEGEFLVRGSKMSISETISSFRNTETPITLAPELKVATTLKIKFSRNQKVSWSNLKYDRMSILLGELSREITNQRTIAEPVELLQQ